MAEKQNSLEFILDLKIGDFLRMVKQAETQNAQSMAGMARSAEKSSKDMESAFNTLGMRPFQDIRAEMKRVETAYDHLAKSGKLSVGELAKAKAEAKKKIEELRSETNGWADQLGGVKDNVAGIAAAFGSLLVLNAAYQSFSNFEQKMSEVNTLLDVTPEKYEAVKEEVLDLTDKIPQTAVELAAAAYDLVSAGVAVDGLSESLELSGKAAVAGVTDTKTAVNAGIGVLNAYGWEIGRLGEVYDKLFVTVKLGVTTFPELAQFIGEVVPTARAAGVSLDEVAASIAALTKAGIRTPLAVNALNATIRTLGMATPETKKKLEELGVTWNGLIGTLGQISKLNLTAEQLRRIVPDEAALKAVLSLTQNFDGLQGILQQVIQSGGAMESAFEKMKDTPENQVKLLTNGLERLKIEAGAVIAEGLLPVIRVLTDMAFGLREADDATKVLVAGMTLLLAGSVIWAAGLSRLATAFKLLQAGILGIAAASKVADMALRTTVVGGVLYALYEIYKLTKAWYELGEAQTSLARSAEALREAAKRYEEFKDFQVQGIQDVIKMNEAEKQAYIAGLRERLKYLKIIIAATEAEAGKTGLLGNQLESAKKAEESLKGLRAEYSQVKEAALAAETAGTQSMDATARGAAQSKISVEEAKKAVAGLGQEYQRLSKDLGAAYDFAAQKAKALATDERAGKDAALDIYRQKANAIMAEAQITATEQLRILQKSAVDEQTWSDNVLAIHRQLRDNKIAALEEYQSKLRAAYFEAINEANKWKTEAERIERELASSRTTFEDKRRELARRTMTEEQAWNDQRKQAYEQLRQAQEALAQAKTPEEMKTAADLFQKAERSAEGLVKEVKNGDQVVKTMAEGFKEFERIAKQAQKGYEEALKAQDAYAKQHQEEAMQRAKSLEEQLQQLQTQMDTINKTELSPTVQFRPDTSQVDVEIERLKQPTSSTHTIYVQKVETDHVGGWVGELHSGGGAWSLPSLSLPSLPSSMMSLKPGEVLAKLLRKEFVLRPEASSALAPWLPAMNRLKSRQDAIAWLSNLGLPSLPKFHEGGSADLLFGLNRFRMPEIPVLHEGGSLGAGPGIGAPTETFELRLRSDTMEVPLQVIGSARDHGDALKQLEKDLGRRRLTRA